MSARVMMLGNGAVLLFGLAAGGSLGCVGDASANDNASALVAAGATSVVCTQISPGRIANRQIVRATIDASGAPSNVTVRRGPAAALEHSADASVAVPGYQNGYYEQTHQLLAWNIGSEGENDYFLLLPDSGIAAGAFTAQLHLYFQHGDAGWWQKQLSCSAL